MKYQPGKPVVAPSILSADYTRFGEQLDDLRSHGVEWIHCDIMDGHFVPNISFGPMIVAAARKAWDGYMDAHLMTFHPDAYFKALVDAGANMVTVHQEAVSHLHRSIMTIRDAGLHAGVAINPATPVHTLDMIIQDVHLVTVMSVNPGFGGQSFIQSTYNKVQQLDQVRKELGLSFLIEIDGGVGAGNIQQLVRAGADILVAGNSVFAAKEPGVEARRLQALADTAHIHLT
jgi:ribulose-phosphate 3-epimerase